MGLPAWCFQVGENVSENDNDGETIEVSEVIIPEINIPVDLNCQAKAGAWVSKFEGIWVNEDFNTNAPIVGLRFCASDQSFSESTEIVVISAWGSVYGNRVLEIIHYIEASDPNKIDMGEESIEILGDGRIKYIAPNEPYHETIFVPYNP